MKRKGYRLLALVISGVLLLSGCVQKPITEETTKEIIIEETTAIEETKEILKYPSADDYYDYINGTFLEDIDIPPDASAWSYPYELGNEAYESIMSILKKTIEEKDQYETGSSQQMIADLYLSAMDLSGRNEAGMADLKPYFELIQNAGTIEEYIHALAVINKEIGMYSLIGIIRETDYKDVTKYCYNVYSADLGPGKEVLEDETQSEFWNSYKAYIASVLQMYGYSKDEADLAGEAVFNLQKELAAVSLNVEEYYDPSKTYNPYTLEELGTLFSSMDVEAYAGIMGLNDQIQLVVTAPEQAKKINEYLTDENLPLLKTFSIYCLIHDFAQYLSIDLRDQYLIFENMKTGIQEQKNDEKLASELTQEALGFEFGKLYVEQHFPEEDKQAIEAMVFDIIAAFESRIDTLDWMAQETKEAAKNKLKTMVVKVGYPDVWPEFNEGAVITAPEDGGVFINNYLELKKAWEKKAQAEIGEPVDKALWMMPPQTVNAYYNPTMNEIVFPAGILQPPYFDIDEDYAANLGGIGFVIGHEITHAFDNTGAQFDEEGNYNIWWSEEDYHQFHQLQQKVVEYFGDYQGIDGIYVNGELTLSENIADLGALSCVAHIIGNDPEKLEIMFERYAQIWAVKMTPEYERLALNIDTHAPGKVRVNAVISSTDAYYIAYPELKLGDKMYLSPEKRMKIW